MQGAGMRGRDGMGEGVKCPDVHEIGEFWKYMGQIILSS